MTLRLSLFTILSFLCFHIGSFAQTITNGDGSPITTQYCWEDDDFLIKGQPAGGTFSGCGVFNRNGQWFFNPVTATAGVSVFPTSCNMTYTVGGSSTTVPILIWKPVVIDPPLEDSATCNGDFFLHAKTLYAGAYDYSWTPSSFLDQPDSPSTTGHIDQTQTFILTAKDFTSGCIGSDTVTISVYPKPQLVTSNDTTIRPLDQVHLFASGATGYEWFPKQWLDQPYTATPIATPRESITYTVVGTSDFGCEASADVHITVLKEPLFFPNAFSPNGDGLNDVFQIRNFGYQRVLSFRIYNRYGQLVFESDGGFKGWDGTYPNGEPARADTYYYHILLELDDGTQKTYKGDVALIR